MVGIMPKNGKKEIIKTAIIIGVGALVLFAVYGFMRMIAVFADLPTP
jgi:hypothetical protein